MLKKSTFNFLTELADNNNREWFAEHKYLYEEAKEDLFALIKPLIKELAAIDPEFSGDTLPKKCLLRIYRDIRFSKLKIPATILLGKSSIFVFNANVLAL